MGVPYRNQGANVLLQAETGDILALSLTFPSPPPVTDLQISLLPAYSDKAAYIALAQLASAGISDAVLTSIQPEVVQPNTAWQLGGNLTPQPGVAKIAWVCHFGNEKYDHEIWIDAQTGEVIGGEPYVSKALIRGRKQKRSLSFYGPGEERTKQAILEQFRKADLILVMRREYHPPQASNAPREKDILVSKIRANTSEYRQLIGSLEKPSPLDPSKITKEGRMALRIFILKLMNKQKLIGQYVYRYDQNLLESDPRYRPKPGWIALAPGPQFRQIIEPPAPKDREIRAHSGNSSKASQHSPVLRR
ncbi:MAG TPA: hypothetical protein VFB21_06995 [Chthonomonadaceae bacterium]|nr:hypothetical protein [Chthonomonadaceae bacterium]